MDSTATVKNEDSYDNREVQCHNVALTSSDEDSDSVESEDVRVEDFRSQVVAANGHEQPVSACANINVHASPNSHIGNKIYTAPVTIVNGPEEDETHRGRAVVTRWCGSRRGRITLGTGWCLLFIVMATYVIVNLTADKPRFYRDIDLNILDRIKFTFFNISRLERYVLLLIGLLILAIVSTVLYYLIFNYTFQHRSQKTDPIVSERGWFITREGWYACPPNTTLTVTNEKYRPLKLVIIAHTVSSSCTSFVKCAVSMRYLQDYAMSSKGYGDISYNFVVGGDGRVYQGRGWNIQGAHTKGYNNISIGIAFIGDCRSSLYPDMRITPEQITRTQKLLQVGVDEGHLSPDYAIKPHCEVRPTLSPGDIVYREIVKWPHYSNNSSYKCKWALD